MALAKWSSPSVEAALSWHSSRSCQRAWWASRPVHHPITGRGELKALGHTVRLMPPAYVKPYVKRQKNDATDAEAICEAVNENKKARDR
jgi:hypothetical protein